MAGPPSTPKPQRTASQLFTPAPTGERRKRPREKLGLTPPPGEQCRSPSPCPTAASMDSLERQGIPRLVRPASRPNFPWCHEERLDIADDAPLFAPPAFLTDDAGVWVHKGGDVALPNGASPFMDSASDNNSLTAVVKDLQKTGPESSGVLQMVLAGSHQQRDLSVRDDILHFDLTKEQPREREDSEEIQFVGELRSTGTVDRPRQRRRLEPSSSPELREITPDAQYVHHHQHARKDHTSQGDGPCPRCGCACFETAGRGRGSGSTTLTNDQRAAILERLLGVDGNRRETLFEQMARRRPGLLMADVAQLIGARREDYDKVRHAARWMQETLPRMMRQGRL